MQSQLLNFKKTTLWDLFTTVSKGIAKIKQSQNQTDMDVRTVRYLVRNNREKNKLYRTGTVPYRTVCVILFIS